VSLVQIENVYASRLIKSRCFSFRISFQYKACVHWQCFLAKVWATASGYLLVLATMGDATQRGTFQLITEDHFVKHMNITIR
jgi:hypothetical protein